MSRIPPRCPVPGAPAVTAVPCRDPDNVVLCLLAAEEEEAGDAALQIHFTLLRAFCCENDINILRVSNPARLAQLLLPAAGPDPPADLHCVLVTVSPGRHPGDTPQLPRPGLEPEPSAGRHRGRVPRCSPGHRLPSPRLLLCFPRLSALFSPSFSCYVFSLLSFSTFSHSLFIFPIPSIYFRFPFYFPPFLSLLSPPFLSLPPPLLLSLPLNFFFPFPPLPQSPKLNSSHASRPDLFVCLGSNLR